MRPSERHFSLRQRHCDLGSYILDILPDVKALGHLRGLAGQLVHFILSKTGVFALAKTVHDGAFYGMCAMWTTLEDEEAFEGIVKSEFLGMLEMTWRCVWIYNSFQTRTGPMS